MPIKVVPACTEVTATGFEKVVSGGTVVVSVSVGVTTTML